LAAAGQQQRHDPDHDQNEQRHQDPAQARTSGAEHRDAVIGRAKHKPHLLVPNPANVTIRPSYEY